MTQIRIRLPKLHAKQREIVAKAERYNVIDAGRRFGKNVVLQHLGINTALDGGPVGWSAPNYRMLMDDWRTVKERLQPITRRVHEQERRLEIITGGVLEFFSLDSTSANSIRGRKFSRFIINEAAFVPNLVEIFNMVIYPTLIDKKGDVFIGGTPKGRNGFYQLYSKTDKDWAKFHYTSYANPHIDPLELDKLKVLMSDKAFRQEILAEFIEDGGGVFRNVLELATAGWQDKPIEGHEYVLGVDWARTTDATAFIMIDATLKEVCYIDRMHDTNYPLQTTRLRALMDLFKPYIVVAEYNSMGGPLVETLQTEGYPVVSFHTTAKSKGRLIDDLAYSLEKRAIKLYNDSTLTGELLAYESEALASGAIRYGAPEGLHDDTVIALALAVNALKTTAIGVPNPLYETNYNVESESIKLWD